MQLGFGVRQPFGPARVGPAPAFHMWCYVGNMGLRYTSSADLIYHTPAIEGSLDISQALLTIQGRAHFWEVVSWKWTWIHILAQLLSGVHFAFLRK